MHFYCQYFFALLRTSIKEFVNLYIRGMNRMLDNSFSYCSNEKCLRFAKKDNIKNGQTYIVLTEECSKNKCYIDKKEYYEKVILDIIHKVPNQIHITHRYLLQSTFPLRQVTNLLFFIKFSFCCFVSCLI